MTRRQIIKLLPVMSVATVLRLDSLVADEPAPLSKPKPKLQRARFADVKIGEAFCLRNVSVDPDSDPDSNWYLLKINASTAVCSGMQVLQFSMSDPNTEVYSYCV